MLVCVLVLNQQFRHKITIYLRSSYNVAYGIFLTGSHNQLPQYLFIYLGFYVAFNTVQVISRRVVGRPEETSTYSWSRFCTVNCQPTASNYQLSHLRLHWEPNPSLRGVRRECYHSATVAPNFPNMFQY